MDVNIKVAVSNAVRLNDKPRLINLLKDECGYIHENLVNHALILLSRYDRPQLLDTLVNLTCDLGLYHEFVKGLVLAIKETEPIFTVSPHFNAEL